MVHDLQIQTLEQRLQPPADAKTSVILNSVGNGMMLGAAPFIVAETISGITDWKIPKGLHWTNALLTTVGVVLGYTSGQKEYKRLQDYRQTVSDEILKLSEHINANDTAIKTWSDRVRLQPRPEAAEAIAR